MENNFCFMAETFQHAGFAFSDIQMRQFYTYYEMLIEKNKVMNLTGITDFKEVIQKHFLDSLSLSQVIDLNDPLRLLDLGTGAGFPGIPLKIAFPKLEIVLMDSLKKRVLFLNDIISELKLSSIETVHARAEDLARDQAYRETFDLCVSRAVAKLYILEEYCLPFVKTGGVFIAYKSGEVEEEAKESERACRLLGGEMRPVFKFHVEEYERSFVIIDKRKTTPNLYPRKAGTPSRFPIV